MVYANLGGNQDTSDANPVTDGKKIEKNLFGMVYGLWSMVYGLYWTWRFFYILYQKTTKTKGKTQNEVVKELLFTYEHLCTYTSHRDATYTK